MDGDRDLDLWCYLILHSGSEYNGNSDPCHDLTLERLFMSLFWFGQGVTRVGILCSVFYVFVFLCFGRVWCCLSLSLIGNHT